MKIFYLFIAGITFLNLFLISILVANKDNYDVIDKHPKKESVSLENKKLQDSEEDLHTLTSSIDIHK